MFINVRMIGEETHILLENVLGFVYYLYLNK